MTSGPGAREAGALLVAGVASTLVLVSLPVFVGAMADAFGASTAEVGRLASADMLGSALGSLAVVPLLERLRWRRAAALGIGVIVAGNLASVIASSLGALLVARAFAGLGAGVLLALAFVGLCRSADPDRWFAIYVFAQLSLQVLALAGLPAVLGAFGIDGVFLCLAGTAAGTLALVPLLPDRMAGPPAAAVQTRPHVSRGGALALAAQGVYFLAPGAAWSYLERIGQTFGLSLPEVGRALGLATFAGMAGALFVATLGARAPRGRALAAGSAVSAVAVLLLMRGAGPTQYLLAAALFNLAWNATFPYQMGVLATLDRDGSVAVLSLLVQLAGLALGPLIGSMLSPGEGFGPLLWACIGCYAASLALFRIAMRRHG